MPYLDEETCVPGGGTAGVLDQATSRGTRRAGIVAEPFQTFRSRCSRSQGLMTLRNSACSVRLTAV